MLNDYSVLSHEILYFKLVYEQKGINRAARKVGQDPANISRMIVRLERKMGEKLFVRHKSGLTPSELGTKLYSAVSNAQSEFSKMFSDKAQRSRRICIGFSPTIAYSHFSRRMLEGLLDQSFRPDFVLRSSAELIEMMKSRHLDFALVNDRVKFPGLIARKVGVENLVLCGIGGPQKTLLLHTDMLGLEKVIHTLSYDQRWMIQDYFVLAKFLSNNERLMGILPESLMKMHSNLKVIRTYASAGRITALTWPGSPGVALLRSFEE